MRLNNIFFHQALLCENSLTNGMKSCLAVTGFLILTIYGVIQFYSALFGVLILPMKMNKFKPINISSFKLIETLKFVP